ncbi:hypothetical protein lerEdw1_004196 [Lerista edwardsae]|nr:hypothetical protein lerEdw1_004196 [Lerista edwardsae]
MKLLLGLTALCVTLVLCHGFCGTTPHKGEIKDGKLVEPVECIDTDDKSKHPIGSSWTKGKCEKCSCSKLGIECCKR